MALTVMRTTRDLTGAIGIGHTDDGTTIEPVPSRSSILVRGHTPGREDVREKKYLLIREIGVDLDRPYAGS